MNAICLLEDTHLILSDMHSGVPRNLSWSALLKASQNTNIPHKRFSYRRTAGYIWGSAIYSILFHRGESCTRI